MNSNLIRTSDLCNRLGVNDSTITRWAAADERLDKARFRRGWWRIDSLQNAGYLTSEKNLADR